MHTEPQLPPNYKRFKAFLQVNVKTAFSLKLCIILHKHSTNMIKESKPSFNSTHMVAAEAWATSAQLNQMFKAWLVKIFQ